MEFSKRQMEIIRMLRKESVMTSEKLGLALHVSSKTIRNEIKEMNEVCDYPYILSVKGSGYYLNESDPSHLETATELNRSFLVLKELLAHDAVNFYELAERLFISEATLNKTIVELNEIITKRNQKIQIKRVHNLVTLNGSEEDRRQVSSYFLMHEIDQYDFDLKNYLQFFQAFDLDDLKSYVLKFNRAHALKMKDFETISFVMHVAIMIERILQGNEIMIAENAITNLECDQLAKAFSKGLEEFIDIKVSNIEIKYLSCLFAGKLPIIENEELNQMKVFVNQILDDILDRYEVDLRNDKDFQNNFLVHLMGLKNRIESNTFLSNPLIEDIKKHFPVLYDISVFIAMSIQEKFHTHLFEDEIGYITLHLMGSLERLHKSSCRRIVILSPMGEAGNGYLRKKLANIHELSIEICEILSIFDTEKIESYHPDLVISFLKEPKGVKYPVYACDALLKDQDLERIYQLLKQSDQAEEASSFFSKDLFFPNQSFQTKEEVIHFLCDELITQCYADPGYAEYVLKREAIAATAYGNLFAIPHPIEKKAHKNMVAICSLNKAIIWNDQKVKLVFLFSLSNERSQEFDKLFEQLVNLLDEISKVKTLIKTEDFEEFLKIFLSPDKN